MAWITPPDFTNGSVVTEIHLDILSNDLLDLHTRLSVREARREQFGQFNATVAANGGAVTQVINYTGFTNPPFITITTGNARLTVAHAVHTNTSASISIANWTSANASNIPIYWHAIEKV